MIHIIGDSHADNYKLFNHPEITTHLIGGTAYNLINKMYKLEEIYKQITPEDKIVFCFGSIDCRMYLYREYIKQKMSYYILIREVVRRYSLLILESKFITETKGVHGIIPERQNNLYGKKFYGSDYQREEICMLFNIYLKDWCEENKIPYFDLYEIPNFIYEDGLINPECTSDGCHINKFPELEKYFLEWIK